MQYILGSLYSHRFCQRISILRAIQPLNLSLNLLS